MPVAGRTPIGTAPDPEQTILTTASMPPIVYPGPETNTASVPTLGGRLQLFWTRWARYFPNSLIPGQLRRGFKWTFISSPPNLSPTPIWFPTSEEQLKVLKAATQQLLGKGAVECLGSSPSAPGFYSRLFLRPKPTRELRPIIDLSSLNTHIICEHFKMETPQSIQLALQQHEWTYQIDIKDAYLHIPIHTKYRKYLRFTVGAEVFQFKTLPFGLSIAPRVFTSVLKPILALLRSRGIKLHAYLDDWLGRALSQLAAQGEGTQVTNLMEYLGWIINWEKTNINGTQTPIFLGLEFQLTIGMVRPGKKAWTEFRLTVRNLRAGQKRTARQLASIIGKLKHWAPYIPRGRLRLRKVQQWYALHWAQASGRWNDQLTLDSHLLSLLHWWAEKAQTSRGVPLHSPTPTQDLFTDASTSGWGASLNNLRAQGTWSEQEARLHVNKLEMMAVHRACVALKPHLSGTTTRVHIDNTTVVAYMKKEGGTRSRELTTLTSLLLHWCDRAKVQLQPTHIAGVRNVIADALSRSGQTQGTEWALTPAEYGPFFDRAGWPSLDLMATEGNRVVPGFISPIPHPEALGVDVFETDWPTTGTLYIFPPTTLVPRIIQMIRSRRPERIFLVASMSPSRTFHPDLREMTTGEPWPLARTYGSLWQIPCGQDNIILHNQPDLYQLGVWTIHSQRLPPTA